MHIKCKDALTFKSSLALNYPFSLWFISLLLIIPFLSGLYPYSNAVSSLSLFCLLEIIFGGPSYIKWQSISGNTGVCVCVLACMCVRTHLCASFFLSLTWSPITFGPLLSLGGKRRLIKTYTTFFSDLRLSLKVFLRERREIWVVNNECVDIHAEAGSP